MHQIDEKIQLNIPDDQITQFQKFLQNADLPQQDYQKLQNSIYYLTYEKPYSSHQINNVEITENQILKIQKEIQDEKRIQNQNFQNTDIFYIGIVGFHHKLGSVIEFIYPNNLKENSSDEEFKKIQEQLTIYCMPDAVHNQNEDFIYFNMEANIKNTQMILFGVSYFKQVKITEKMKAKDPQLTRSHMQKSLFVLTGVPLQAYIISRLQPTMKAYFQQEEMDDFELLQQAHANISQNLKNFNSIGNNEIYLGIKLKALVYFFQEKTFQLLKALLLEKKIIVYSQNSSSCSNFINTLISLIPGLSYFQFFSDCLNIDIQGLREYGLPLRIFNEIDRPLEPYYTIQKLDCMDYYKSYLIGTTSQLIKQHKITRADLLVDLDMNQIVFLNNESKSQLQVSFEEKNLIDNIIKQVNLHIDDDNQKDWKNIEFTNSNDTSFLGSNDWIRQQFNKYIIDFLCEVELFKIRYDNVNKEIDKIYKNNSVFIFYHFLIVFLFKKKACKN
ncbi:lalv9 family protein, putative [Ichthyophthirius multifiliis]|uniref:Lalv9 family protein, putative n=1 Tax=Ichthyophthirius multifiliis TaxID=5932 RepID=G0QVF0_ICHMU|nr:lalv9 family protein, putative [Ichthyophthirius multifiliis]EGR30807.1 lalv9 family protein, putative [Ichthyophthirius multifiliis]|eukprot:XP_004032394.1 lalv9 family protein, putative [Ichthyophthirius multifiliis]